MNFVLLDSETDLLLLCYLLFIRVSLCSYFKYKHFVSEAVQWPLKLGSSNIVYHFMLILAEHEILNAHKYKIDQQI